jgi:hypothetical protein
MTRQTNACKQVLYALLRLKADGKAVDIVAVRDVPHAPDVATPFGVEVAIDEIKFCQHNAHQRGVLASILEQRI